MDELNQAAAVVGARYSEAGYGGVVAFIGPQDASNGTVTITVIEGRLTAVEVEGNQQFSASNVLAGLPSLNIGATPLLTQIDTQILISNENPAKQVQVLLQPGKAPGEIAAQVKVIEDRVQRFTIGLDDTGSERTGEHRLNLGWQHANVAGLDHVLTTQLQTSVEKPDLVRVGSVGYRMPFYAHSLTLDVFGAYSDVDGGTSATLAGDLRFAGKGRILGARLNRYLPRLGEMDQRLSVGVEQRDYLNTCSIAGFPTGACGPAGESVTVRPLSLDYTLQQGGERPVAISVALLHNLRLGGRHAGDSAFDAVRPGASANYTIARFTGYGAAKLAEDWVISARVAGQATIDALVPGEQFGIGGAGTVRGYEEREITGDRGAFVSLELATPEFGSRLGLVKGSLRMMAFVDGGYVENLLSSPCNTVLGTSCSLGSIGIGWRLAVGDFQGRLFIAHAMKEGGRTGRNDTRVHFSLSYSF